MSGSSTKGSERSPLLSPEQSSSDANSYQSFPDIVNLDAPDSEAPLLENVSLPSSASRGVTALRGTSIVASLGVLVFLQGTMGFPDSQFSINEYQLAFVDGSSISLEIPG